MKSIGCFCGAPDLGIEFDPGPTVAEWDVLPGSETDRLLNGPVPCPLCGERFFTPLSALWHAQAEHPEHCVKISTD